MAFEGGLTSAINSAAERERYDWANKHLSQIIQERAIAMQLQNEAQQRAAQGREDLGSVLPGLPPLFAAPPTSGPPMGAPPPRMAPGEASVPMGPPQAAPMGPAPQAADFGQGPMAPGAPAAAPLAGAAPEESPSPGMTEPQALPQPIGWQVGSTASEELGGTPPGGGAMPSGAEVGAPPPTPQLPPQLWSAPVLIDALAKNGIKGERALEALRQFEPIMKQQNDTAIKLFEAGVRADKAGELARAKEFENQTRRLNVNSQIEGRGRLADARDERNAGLADANRIKQQQLDSKLTGTLAGSGADLTKEPETLRFMAEQYWAGDRMVLTNLGRGVQGAANIVALRKEVAKIGKETGQSPRELATAQAEFEGLKAGERVAGTRGAQIEIAANEAKVLSDLAVQASEAFDRTGWKSINDIYNAVKSGTASPELRRFVVADTSLVNAYARAISPVGVPTVSDKDHARQMLNTAFAKGDYAAGVEQLQNELEAALKSPGMAKEAMRARAAGREATPGMAPRPAGTAAGATSASIAIQGGKPKPDGDYDSPAGRVRVKNGVATLIGPGQ